MAKAPPPGKPRRTVPKYDEPDVEPEAVEPVAEPVVEPMTPAPPAEPPAEPPKAAAAGRPAMPPVHRAPMSEDRLRYLLQSLQGTASPGEPGAEVAELIFEGYLAECDGKLDLTAKGRDALNPPSPA